MTPWPERTPLLQETWPEVHSENGPVRSIVTPITNRSIYRFQAIALAALTMAMARSAIAVSCASCPKDSQDGLWTLAVFMYGVRSFSKWREACGIWRIAAISSLGWIGDEATIACVRVYPLNDDPGHRAVRYAMHR